MWMKWLSDAGRDSLILGENASASSPQFEQGSERNLLPQSFYHQTHLRCHGPTLMVFRRQHCTELVVSSSLRSLSKAQHLFFKFSLTFSASFAEVQCHVKPCRS